MKQIEIGCDFDEFVNIDVLHISFWYGKRASIQKVIENISKNTLHLNHCNLALRSFANQPHVIAEVVNYIKPRIIHLHINARIKEMDFISMLHYRPYVVQTVHENMTSQFPEADKIVCIHQECYSQNKPNKQSIIIENTVDVTGFKKHKPNDNGVCSHFRFAPERLRKSSINLYKKISAPVTVYGKPDHEAADYEYNKSIYQMANNTNIDFQVWNCQVEKEIIKHSLYLYYVPNNNHLLCYGLSLMEAVALGMPVVAVQRKQIYQQYIDVGENGLICNNDEQVVDKVHAILTNPIMYEELCYGAKAKSKKLLNVMPLQYQSVYETA